MTLIGVDTNATRARALHDTAAGPVPVALEPGQVELPMALSLENRTPVVGRAGLALCRKMPHLACLDFLPYLGTARQWTHGRHRLDAAGAFHLICQHLQPRFAKASGVVLTLPAYLGEGQADLAIQIAQKARWNVLGAVPTPVAAALAAQEYLPWSGLALVVDVDGYALTWSAVAIGEERARLVDVRASGKLALGLWMRALVDGVARRCVRMSRRDPRACADTEQSVHEQLLAVLERGPRNGIVELNIQSPQWYQNLMLAVDELTSFTVPLAELARAEMSEFLAGMTAFGPVGALILTSAADRLPGLAAALGRGPSGTAEAPPAEADGDFGEGLLEGRAPAHVHALEADGIARAAYDLAVRFHRGELGQGWQDEVPLPAADLQPLDAGAGRLHYRGQDHFLKKPCFILGREPGCDLLFASDLFPSVSARHCEIARDKQAFILRDRSRHGTLVNDRPINGQTILKAGDWIRLGPGGPLLRFLGRGVDPLQLITIAK